MDRMLFRLEEVLGSLIRLADVDATLRLLGRTSRLRVMSSAPHTGNVTSGAGKVGDSFLFLIGTFLLVLFV